MATLARRYWRTSTYSFCWSVATVMLLAGRVHW